MKALVTYTDNLSKNQVKGSHISAAVLLGCHLLPPILCTEKPFSRSVCPVSWCRPPANSARSVGARLLQRGEQA
jgi:hypothetical protein